jgi:hypothetical protein
VNHDEEFALESLIVDVIFNRDKPTFGDLLLICGMEHPHFPATGRFKLFLAICATWQALPDTALRYQSSQEAALERLRKDAEAIQKYWQEQGITVGSSEALEIDM